MDRDLLRLALRAWLTGLVGSIVVLWLVFHTRFRTSFWDSMAERPLSGAEATQLAQCEIPSWWTWLKIVRADPDIECGEVWVVEGLADKVRDHDRALWLHQRSEQPELPLRTRMRVALALLVAGQTARDEPAWLVDQLEPAARSAWIAAAGRSPAVASQLGPRLYGLGMLWRAERGGLDEAEVLPTLYWLAHVDDALAERETAHVAAALAEIPVDLGSQLWRRRAAGLPVGRPQARFAPRVLAHPECGSPAADAAPRCAALYAEILDLVLTDAALESGTPPPADPPEPPAIAELLTAVQASVSERRAVARGIAVAAAWVRAAPDPAARLRSLAARPPDGRWAAARVTWDGSGTPLLGALVLSVIGEQADVEVEVRNDAKGAWWFRIGGVDVTRTCGEVGAPPEGSPWPRAGLVAGALLERAQLLEETDVALRRHLAMAAQRIDPLVGGPLAAQLADTAPPDLAIGRRIGASLLGPLAVPSGADGGRRALGEGGPRLCPSRVN